MEDSRVGVDGVGGVEGGVDGRFLSADWALFCANGEGEGTVLVIFGEGQRLGPEELEREGDVRVDLYLELTSLVLIRRLSALFFSAGTNGGLAVSTAVCFCARCCASHSSIHTVQIRPH